MQLSSHMNKIQVNLPDADSLLTWLYLNQICDLVNKISKLIASSYVVGQNKIVQPVPIYKRKWNSLTRSPRNTSNNLNKQIYQLPLMAANQNVPQSDIF